MADKAKKDDRVGYVITINVLVLANKGRTKDAEDTLQNYLSDWIPDETPDDPIFIADFYLEDGTRILPNYHPRVIAAKKRE